MSTQPGRPFVGRRSTVMGKYYRYLNRFSDSIYAIKIRFEPVRFDLRFGKIKFTIRLVKDLNRGIITYQSQYFRQVLY